jgi:hypothetical protein
VTRFRKARSWLTIRAAHLELGQLLFQRLDREDVQVVGRLVQQQHVGLFGEGARQGGAALLATRQALCALLGIQAEVSQGGLSLVVLGAAGGAVVQQGVAGDLRLLTDEDDLGAGLHRALAAVGLDALVGQDLQQCALARAVAADQAGAHARLQGQVDAVEQGLGAVGETDILEGENRRAGRGEPWIS